MLAQRQSSSYNLAFIKNDFNVDHDVDFDPEYIKILYDYGYQAAKKGYEWDRAPPGFDPNREETN